MKLPFCRAAPARKKRRGGITEAEAEGRKSSTENKARQLKGSRHVAIDKFASIVRLLSCFQTCVHAHDATREKEKENEGKREREIRCKQAALSKADRTALESKSQATSSSEPPPPFVVAVKTLVPTAKRRRASSSRPRRRVPDGTK